MLKKKSIFDAIESESFQLKTLNTKKDIKKNTKRHTKEHHRSSLKEEIGADTLVKRQCAKKCLAVNARKFEIGANFITPEL